MRSVLILFAHPAYQRSRVNRKMAEAVRNLDGITFRDLYEEYPEFDIDVSLEQQLLTDHDIIVFQHPFYWYSTPAVLKEWQDLVLEHGWAYGSSGNALEGKKIISVITTGGGEQAYRKDGYNRFTIRELLRPIEQMAFLCGVEYLPPFTVHGTLKMHPDEVREHTERYKALIVALRDETLNWKKVRKVDNLDLDVTAFLMRDTRSSHAG